MSKVTYLSIPLIYLCFLTLQQILLRHQQSHCEQPKRIQRNQLTINRCTTKGYGVEANRKEIEEIVRTRAVSGSNSRHGGKKTVLTLLDDRDQSLLTKSSVFNDTLACLGPCWYFSDQLSFSPLPLTRMLVHFCICTYL